MCLGIPGRIVEIVPDTAGQLASVEVLGVPRPINLGMLEEPVQPGSWVLIHLGFAVSVIDEAEAAAAQSGLELMGRPLEPGEVSAP